MTASELITELGWLHPDCPVEFSPITDAWLGTSGPMRVPKDGRGKVTVYDKHGETPTPDTPANHHRAIIYIYEDESK